MPRSYRGILAALAGLVLAAAHPNAEAQPKQTEAQQRSASALERIATRYDQQAEGAQRSNYEQPCERGDDQRDSDLCAQWKAADAAADAAWWAAVAGFATAASTILVLIALYFAFRSNWIARDTAKRQLRAYMGLIKFEEKRTRRGLVMVIAFKNFGQTPAKRAKCVHFLTADPNVRHDQLDWKRDDWVDIQPGEEWGDMVSHPIKTTEEKFWVLELRFTDVFGTSWGNRLYANKKPRGRWHACEGGNYEYELPRPRGRIHRSLRAALTWWRSLPVPLSLHREQ